jgi:DNA-binding MarR family transcriptional regulator
MTIPNPYPAEGSISEASFLRMGRLVKVMTLLRTFDPEVPSQVLAVFFYVASHNGCLTTGLTDKLGMAQSSLSRCTDWLSDYHRLGKPGMGLIAKVMDRQDRRARRLYLTRKGELVSRQIIEDLYDD